MTETKNKLQAETIIIWTVLSIGTTAILIVPLFTDKQTILQNAPTCISKKQFNTDCFMCGMTRAFIEISGGNFTSAQTLNKGSIILYFSFLFNTILFFAFGRPKLFQLIKLIDDG